MKNDKPNLKGYRTIWIQYGVENTDRHQLFLKEHSIRKQEPEHPRGKTLFVLNIPPYVTEICLQKAFSQLCGNVERVTFTTQVGFKTAYIVFRNESSLENAVELCEDTVLVIDTPDNRCLTGIEKWCKEYNDSLCNEAELKKDIEDYMNNYDQTVAMRIAKEKAAAESRDGWVTVTGKKKRGQFALARKESTINKLQNVDEQKKKKKQLLNFYTFQIREAKKQNLAELRKKFELDKKRLQELKSKRTFKPF